MPNLTIGFGVALILTGIGAYFVSDGASVTAFIPSFIGLPMILAGWAMTRPRFYAVGLYGAIGLAVVMIVGSMRGILGFFKVLSGDGSFTFAIVLQLVLVALSLVFIALNLRFVRFGRSLKA
jgi:hypothetical protein